MSVKPLPQPPISMIASPGIKSPSHFTQHIAHAEMFQTWTAFLIFIFILFYLFIFLLLFTSFADSKIRNHMAHS